MDHGMANIEPGLRLHFVAAGDGDFTAVLLHGFPQTWQEWRHVIQPVSEAGFRIIAPDYRGARHSSRPLGGYDKLTMANDIRYVGRDHLGLSGLKSASLPMWLRAQCAQGSSCIARSIATSGITERCWPRRGSLRYRFWLSAALTAQAVRSWRR
jgi:hypothetical protein